MAQLVPARRSRRLILFLSLAAIILLVGLFSGTYSSIFIAAPILVVWESKEWRSWFRRGEAAA